MRFSMASEEELRAIDNRLIREQLTTLLRRNVPESDPRIKALYRILAAQGGAGPREGRDFPVKLKFDGPRRQNGQS